MVNLGLVYTMVLLPAFPWVVRMLLNGSNRVKKWFINWQSKQDLLYGQTLGKPYPRSPLAGRRKSVQEGYHRICYTASSSQDEGAGGRRRLRGEVHVYGAYKTSSMMLANDEEPVTR